MVTQQGLQLYLKLEELTQKGNLVQAPDASGNSYSGTVHGKGMIVPNDIFGSAMLFNGTTDWIELPQNFQLQDTFSLSGWISSSVGVAQDQCFFGKHAKNGDNQFLIGYWKKKLLVRILKQTYSFKGAVPPANTWFHLAITVEKVDKNQTQVTAFIDGKLFGQTKIKSVLSSTSGKPWTIGQDWDKKKLTDFFNGSMNDIRFFNRVISQEEIAADMLASKSASEVFKTTYPLGFNLTDNDVQNALYIANTNDGVQEQVNLSVTNTSTKSILFKPIAKDAKNAHHLELRFRPYTFEDTIVETKNGDKWQYLNMKSVPANWKASEATLDTVDNTVSVYLTYVGGNDLPLQSKESLQFIFEYDSANIQNGARGTQVMLEFHNIQYADATSLISGNRLMQVDIVNQRGKKNIPLHVGFVGSNTILNDSDPGTPQSGTASSLKFRIFNTLKTGLLRFNTQENTVNTTLQSKLTITFDALDDDWALATPNELAEISVEAVGSWATITKKLQGSSPTIQLDNFSVSSLAAGSSIDLILGNIRSSKPSGFSNIYIRYEDIPGYWDGEFVLVVEKTPIIARNVGTEKHVGIGVMPDTKHQLRVGGNVKIEADPDDDQMFLVGSKDGTKNYLAVDKDGQLGLGSTSPQAPLSIYEGSGKERTPDGGMHITNDCILFGGNNKGKQMDSAQISAGLHKKNTLCIVGMSTGKNYATRKVEIWAEGGATVTGSLNVSGKVQENGNVLIPKGAVMMWTGTTRQIPAGWALCDGTQGTPYLVDNFVIGAGKKFKPGSMGGAETVTLSPNQMPSHSHGVKDPGHLHSFTLRMRYSSTDRDDSSLPMYANDNAGFPNTNTAYTGISINAAGGNQPHDNMPPYYALCYIMKL